MRQPIRFNPLLGLILTFFLAATAVAGAASDLPAAVAVDSGETLAADPSNTEEDRVYQELGGWETAGDAEGWNLASAGTVTVADGSVHLTESGTALVLGRSLTGEGRTDLDLGYNDYLWLRCRLPQGAAGNLRFSFTTTLEPDYSDDKSFMIPAARLVADGAFHEYLIDLGLVRRWRGFLTNIRVEPFASSAPAGRTFDLDFLRVGDRASDVLALNTNINFYTGENLGMCSRRLSKHFALWWSPETQTFLTSIAPTLPAFATDTDRQRTCLRMCEETYQHFCKVQGYVEPFHAINGSVAGTFKENITTWWHGGFGAAYADFSTINVHAPAMTTDEAGNAIRHELGHSIQAAMPGYFNGNHWESHVGYMHVGFMNYWGEVTDQGLGLSRLSWINYVDKTMYKSCLMFEWPGFVYADRRPYGYLDTDPDGFGLPPDLTATMWATPPKEQFFPDALAKQVPAGVSDKDLTLGWSRRIPFFDSPNGADERDWFFNVFQTSASESAVKRQRMGMILAASPDRPGYWHSTCGTAPMGLGYSFHELQRPSGGKVTAQLNGLDIAGDTEDWRWCLVAITGSNSCRYSGFSKPGEVVTFDLTENETALWLVVAATPTSLNYNLNYRENVWNLDKHPGRMRYPFEIQLQGTQPKAKQVEIPNIGTGHAHTNGGGFVANTATVDATAYVGPAARVLGTAKVLGQARIEGQATVVDATIRDSARVSGSALVYGTSVTIRDQARVRDRATAYGGVVLSGNALLDDHATFGQGSLTQNATARGISETYTSSPHLSQISGHAILDGDYVLPWNATDGVHKTHVPWGDFYWDYYAKWLKKPEGLIARYRVEETDGDFLWDCFGSMHALLRGKPQRTHDTQMLDQVLILNGEQQYVVLDPSIGDSAAASFAAWCNLDAANTPGTPLLFLGYKSTEYLALIPANADGKPELVIQREGGTVTRVTAPTAVSNGTWTHLGFTLDGATAILYVNGVAAASAACDLVPCSLITPDIQTVAQANYVGRGWSGATLKAKVDDLRFYNVAITPAAMAKVLPESGRTLTILYDDTPLTLAADSTDVINSGIVSPEECTIFVEVNPDLADDVAMFRPILDSHSDTRQIPNSGADSPALGIDNGKFVVYLQGSGRWDTGATCVPGTWQKVALTYGRHGASLFVNGAEVASRGDQQAFPREVTFLIGCSRLATASRFAGSLRNLRILDRALDRDEVLRALGTNVYGIEAETTFGGTISPSPYVLVNAGGSQTFTITPDPGYSIRSVTVDGTDLGVLTTYAFSNVTAAHSITAAFTRTDTTPGSIVRQDQLLFACLAGSLPASGPAGPWPTFLPAGATLSPMNSPMVETVGGKTWVQNLYASANGFDFGQFTTPIPCNGVTIVTAVRPVRNAVSSPYPCIVSAFHNHLVLGVRNDTGAIYVSRNGVTNNTSAIIPDGRMTILSLVVQPDGKYKVFANGTQVVSVTATSAYTSIVTGSQTYAHNITIGRNYADSWSTFNGNIGDVLFYKTALIDTERVSVENSVSDRLTAAGVTTYAIQASATIGGSISPAGDVVVNAGTSQTFTISALPGYALENVYVDNVPQGAVTGYTFSNINADHTILATFVSTVNTPPTVSSVADQSVTMNHSTATLAFTVGDAETPAANLTVTAASSDTTLVPDPNINLAGSGASRTVIVTPASGRTGSAIITLNVSDGSLTTSSSFMLTVTPPPPPKAISVNYDRAANTTPALSPTASAGVVAVMNWNNIASDGSGGILHPTQTFHDDQGADVLGFTVSASSGSADTWNTGGTADQIIYGDWLKAGAGTTLTLAGIPFANYDLYIYESHYVSNEVVRFTIGGNVQTLTNTGGNPASVSPTHRLNDTYVKFTGLTSPNISVAVAAISGSAGIAGFQIVNNPATPVLSLANSPVTYNGSAQAATVNGSVAGTVSNVRYNGSLTVPAAAGTYAITADFIPTDTTNYNSLSSAAAGDFVINKATPSLMVANSPVTYNGSAQAATVNGSVAGLAGNVRYNGSPSVPASAGTYAVTADFIPVDTTNFNSLSGAAAGNFVINKATPSLTVANSPVTFNGSPQAAMVNGSVAGAVSNVRYNSTLTVPAAAGTYSITADFIPNDTTNFSNLSGAAAGDFVINKAALTVTATGPAKTYGTALATGPSTDNFTATGTMSGETVTSVTLTPDAAGLSTTTPAGTAYMVTPSLATGTGGFLESNYQVTYNPYTGTTGKARAVVNLTGLNAAYDGKPKAASSTTVPEGLAVTCTYDGSSTPPTNPGTYAVIATIDDINHEGSATGSLVISNTFASWINGFPGVGSASGFDEDADGDGIRNGIECYLGSNPAQASAGLTAVAATASGLKFRHTRSNNPPTDITAAYQWSTDTIHWFSSGQTNGQGVSATLTSAVIDDTNAPDNDLIEVTLTITAGTPGTVFARLTVAKTP